MSFPAFLGEASPVLHRRAFSVVRRKHACDCHLIQVLLSPYNHSRGFSRLYRTASLLRPARCYAPPLIFGRNYCIGLFYLHYTPPPPRGPLEPVCRTAFCTCTRVASVEELYLCIKRIENSLRTSLGLFDLGRLPEAVILPSRPVGGVWLRDYLLCFATCAWPTSLPSVSTATACRSKEFSSSTALQSTRIRGRGGGA